MTPTVRRLARIAPLRIAYQRLRSEAFRGLCRLSPELLMRWRYRRAWGYWPDLANPQTFDEKLIWLNLYWRHPLKSRCADKYMLRDYVARHELAHLLPQIYGVWDAAPAVELLGLPDRFVLKCSHGCKCNVFCWDKAAFDLPNARRQLRRWMATDYSLLLGELHYAGMTPRIVCEEFLDDGTGELPTDYKLYCFGGHVHCTLVCHGRTANDNAIWEYYSREWSPLAYGKAPAGPGRLAVPPAGYEMMLHAAEKLSRPYPFVRVDFYSIAGRAILGEMTFTPSACIDTTHSELAVRELGALIQLPGRLVAPGQELYPA